MPHTYQANSYQFDTHMTNLQSKGEKAEKNMFIFCCFCANYKFDAELFRVWMNIIKRVPESLLWLLGESSSVSRNLHQIAISEGVDPGRLHFADKKPKDCHLARLQDADLALDTQVVNGAATTSDALWAGVPVVTVKGSHFASRMSASILAAVGLSELITDDLKQYEDLAVALAIHPEKLNSAREKLEMNKCSEPLFDTRRFVRNLENAFEQMWEIYLAGDKPRHIHVQDRGPIPTS
jgi:protein O-GlcNAc transferase